MQPGHREIERKINLLMRRIDVNLRVIANQIPGIKRRSWNVVLFVLGVPFDTLDPQESQTENQGKHEQNNQELAFPHLCRTDSERHRQTAADQNDGVDRAQSDVQTPAARCELIKIPEAVD